MKILNIPINGIEDYYKTYMSIIQPITPMTPQETKVLAAILTLKVKLGLETRKINKIVTSDTFGYIEALLKINKKNYHVIISKLRQKKVIIDGELSTQYDIPYEEQGGIIFSFKTT